MGDTRLRTNPQADTSMKLLSLPFLGLSVSAFGSIRLQTKCEKERQATENNGAGYSSFNPVICQRDGSYHPRQTMGWNSKKVCVTPWGGQYRFEEDPVTGQSCDQPWVRPGDDRPCHQSEFDVMMDHEEAAKHDVEIADLSSPSCDENGKFETYQNDPMMGQYCIDQETGEFTGMPMYRPDGTGDCSHPIAGDLYQEVDPIPAIPDYR